MSKRFKAKIDWHDSGWIDTRHSPLYCAVRFIGPFRLYVDLSGKVAHIAVKGEIILCREYTNKYIAKIGCERALRRLLK